MLVLLIVTNCFLKVM